MADIFLSYNEKDRDVACRLAETLGSVGLSVWWDRRIPAGTTWRRLLERELRTMRCMVVVWSTHSVKSEWVCEEATEGRELGCLIPVRIEAVRPPAGFREIQAADLIDWDGTATFVGMRTLIEDIRRKMANPGRDATLLGRTTTSSFRRLLARDATTTSPPIRVRGWPARTLMIVAMLAVGGIAATGVQRALDRSGGNAAAGPGRVTSPVVDADAADRSGTAAPESTTTTPPVPETFTTPTRPSVGKAVPRPGTRDRCEDLRQRLSLGETPSAEALSVLQKECGK